MFDPRHEEHELNGNPDDDEDAAETFCEDLDMDQLEADLGAFTCNNA